ncbi:NAD(P)/FAD-dependent oxidoreductase [Mariniblastus fucicola]|uniref:Gamma-glutamylputrescine oxidoreductase n=1 Tax=Mariniblastus fucicola TaxID=980251 RepID=A0A5B9PFC4_9BACT|nr:FAD-dependent oxidoreductase [Mariniblastus fucicola]QEG24249.1 Gamma-glutamylputrescine oxidoreductase [Mariniblastus fucicola]
MPCSEPTLEHNSWLDGVGTLPTFSKVEQDQSVDWLIVGAGFTGVAAARRIAIAKPDDRVLIVDAGEVLDGSSSRSSGFVVPIGHFYHPRLPENEKLYRLGSDGIRQLRELVEHHRIDCDWNNAGRLIGARAAPGMKSLNRIARSLEALGSPIVRLSGEQVREHTSMATYHAAIRQTESVMVNPAKLLRGLIETLPPNVTLMTNSAVTAVLPNGNAIVDGGIVIESGQMILSVNAFANQFGIGKHRVFPMRTFVSEVEFPTSGQENPAWGITSSERVGSSIRRVGNRLFIRNTAEFGTRSADPKAELKRVASFQLRTLQSRFSGVADVSKMQVANTWSGPISITANGGSLFGQSSDNVYFATGYNGHGIAHGTTSGRLLAELAMGHRSELLALIQSLKKPNWIPGGAILKSGVDAYVRLLRWRFGAEE